MEKIIHDLRTFCLESTLCDTKKIEKMRAE
jgi:hypothetical protein